MDGQRIGATVRAVRIRRRWRQQDLADNARVSRGAISRIERGHVEGVTVAMLDRLAIALEIVLKVELLWHGADRDRLLNARHSAMHELVARMLAMQPGWIAVPEVSFSIYGERGVVDIVAWHAETRTLLLIELKTEVSDVQELVGTMDRKRRLGRVIARDRGWDPLTISAWLIVADSMTNRRRVASHETMLRSAFPDPGRRMAAWLRRPRGPVAGLSFLPINRRSGRGSITGVRRVQRPRDRVA